MYPSICLFCFEFSLFWSCWSCYALSKLWFFMCWPWWCGLFGCWLALTNEYWELRSSVLLYLMFFSVFLPSIGEP